MPSWCIYSSLLQSLLIILIICFEKSLSANDYQHQILKADVGQDVTMSCIFDEEKIEQVSFMRQMTGDILSLGSELFVHEFSSNQHIKLIQFSTNRLDLKLISVNQNDSGIYTCMFNDEKLTSFSLEIFVPPLFISYSPLEGSASYSEGSSMNLSCHAFAIPSANITWIYRDKNKQTKIIHYGEHVYISSLQSSDSGSYECIASNNFHASISRSFYVTIQYSPRVMILNDKMASDIHDTVIVKCHVCSNPQVIQINWLKHGQMILDVNILTKTQTIDSYQCSEAIMEIVDINEYQFGQYECRAENNLGQNSAYIDIHQTSRNLKLKQQEMHSNEVNRNGRTALLIDNQQKFDKNFTITSTQTPKLFSNSSVNLLAWFNYYSLTLLIFWTRPV
ncbi:unnamed protein product [Rotaria magnacalcarata]|uniref:Ig-like domain-containing protein n=1 Tax=Rotaria magnacalcarata TaxID=392030 RepID=A0A816NXF2_9BILA|nr:unnamed protein product [Rotaria magnacalcarata]CAF1622595.1 unnamed protein product [Rotaria magnacalcarata]CAF2041266.1 unnamed protein product [Rotaria magnacalcarata]CAF2117169.1 unnamed protein product [Rotaria magnacalcarata]CAF2181172.1 unnamed protein product [Rotaria magnacalcarata]